MTKFANGLIREADDVGNLIAAIRPRGGERRCHIFRRMERERTTIASSQ